MPPTQTQLKTVHLGGIHVLNLTIEAQGVLPSESVYEIDLVQKCEVKKKKKARDFPGGPVAKTPCCQCRGPEFNHWSGN